jgi:putative transposase
MVEYDHPLFSLEKQCTLLGIHRSGLYYRAREVDDDVLQLMRAIDEQYLQTPFFGKRRMSLAMQERGFSVGPRRVRKLMLFMGLEAIYPKPKLSMSNKEHRKYPYLMRMVEVTKPNQAWAADITYLPLNGGFGYLMAIMDWYSRYVIEWELSTLLDAQFCVEALERALKSRIPEIFNTDQGVQFTCAEFIRILEEAGTRISMDGKGRALDNVFVERLWRSVKYEDVYPRGYSTLNEAREGLGRYFSFYNHKRPHQGIGYKKPVEMYR